MASLDAAELSKLPVPALYALFNDLAKLPVSTLHALFNDLPRSSVLAIACHKDPKYGPYLHECILTSPKHGKAFPDPAALEAACDYYLLLTEIHKLREYAVQPNYWIINSYQDYNPNHVHARIAENIDSLCPNDPLYYAQFIPPTSNVWDSSTLPLLRERFNAISTNVPRMQAEKLDQLHRVHALLESHHRLLKSKMDPSQEPRPKMRPLLERLHKQKKLLLECPFKNGVYKNSMYRPHNVWMYLGRWIPVPYDRYLIMLLKVLGKYPLPDGAMPGVRLPEVLSKRWRLLRMRPVPVVPEYFSEEESYMEVPDDGNDEAEKDPAAATAKKTKKIKYLDGPKPTHTHVYPPSAISNIRTALLGLQYTYSVPGVSARPRTLYTLYSAPENQTFQRNLQPCFAKPEEVEPLAYAVNGREIQWLEAFVACCDYVCAMEERWNEKMTVAEWWKSRELRIG